MAEEKFTTEQANAALAWRALDMMDDSDEYAWPVTHLLKPRRPEILSDAIREYIATQWGCRDGYDGLEMADLVKLYDARVWAEQSGQGGEAAWKAYQAAEDLSFAAEECEQAVFELARAVCDLCGLPDKYAEF